MLLVSKKVSKVSSTLHCRAFEIEYDSSFDFKPNAINVDFVLNFEQ